MYQARKVTGVSLCSLINAAEKGNFKITRRRDKKKFFISWGVIHDKCFEIRKMKRKEEEREKDLEEWQKELSKKEFLKKWIFNSLLGYEIMGFSTSLELFSIYRK